MNLLLWFASNIVFIVFNLLFTNSTRFASPLSFVGKFVTFFCFSRGAHSLYLLYYVCEFWSSFWLAGRCDAACLPKKILEQIRLRDHLILSECAFYTLQFPSIFTKSDLYFLLLLALLRDRRSAHVHAFPLLSIAFASHSLCLCSTWRHQFDREFNGGHTCLRNCLREKREIKQRNEWANLQQQWLRCFLI